MIKLSDYTTIDGLNFVQMNSTTSNNSNGNVRLPSGVYQTKDIINVNIYSLQVITTGDTSNLIHVICHNASVAPKIVSYCCTTSDFS